MMGRHPAVGVSAGELRGGITLQRTTQAVNLFAPRAKHNTPEIATRPDTPRELPSTDIHVGCGALICGDALNKVVNPQVLPSDSTWLPSDIHTPSTGS